jgi:peptidoglycan/xylan/chitin deacetylase (PgdA/CDA1 family)
MKEPVAVLMYHSIAPRIESWDFSHLSLPPEVFDDHMARLRRSGYNSVTLSEVYDYVAGKTRLPPKAVVITFDDGYLDNWVYAFPILKKHGMRGTVFVSTDFIDRTPEIRPNTDDVAEGRARAEDLDPRGFLSTAEMERMINSQLIQIHGHCKTHTWYFTSSRIVDFNHPGSRYPWLGWNVRVDRKPMYMSEDQSEFVPWGSPVYEHRESLIATRYFPDPRVEVELADIVEGLGGRDFFQDPEWRTILTEKSEAIRKAGLDDRVETEEQRLTRLREEIPLAKQELTDLLGHEVEYLCWPNGKYDDTCVEMAREAGFKAWTLKSADRDLRRNVPGEDVEWIRRLDVSPWWFCRGRKVCHVDGEFLERIIADYKGFTLSGFRLKWYKMEKFIESLFGG